MSPALSPNFDPALIGQDALNYIGKKHIETLRKLVRQGKIKAIREPGSHSTMRFRLSELNRYLSTLECQSEAR